tara:strand:- start:52 stop:330 length:279 start_codon:yes stop_codon:yes gene_type:complete
MNGVARINDAVDAPTKIVMSPGGSSVLVNGLPISVQGSITAPHNHGDSIVIGVFNQQFSSTVTAENKPILRLGDAANCGHKIIAASSNVRSS